MAKFSTYHDSIGGSLGFFSDFLSTYDEDFKNMWMIGFGDYPDYNNIIES